MWSLQMSETVALLSDDEGTEAADGDTSGCHLRRSALCRQASLSQSKIESCERYYKPCHASP